MPSYISYKLSGHGCTNLLCPLGLSFAIYKIGILRALFQWLHYLIMYSAYNSFLPYVMSCKSWLLITIISSSIYLYSFIHTFIIFLLSSLCKPNSALSDESTVINKTPSLSSRSSQSCEKDRHVNKVTTEYDTYWYMALQMIPREHKTHCVLLH